MDIIKVLQDSATAYRQINGLPPIPAPRKRTVVTERPKGELFCNVWLQVGDEAVCLDLVVEYKWYRYRPATRFDPPEGGHGEVYNVWLQRRIDGRGSWRLLDLNAHNSELVEEAINEHRADPENY